MTPNAPEIIALAALIVALLIALAWAYDTWPRRIVPDEPDDYGPTPNVETRAREASGEDGRWK
jgi:hypothetical protein